MSLKPILHTQTGEIVVIEVSPLFEINRQVTILGTKKSLDMGLELTDEELVTSLSACSDVGKILESKGIKVIY
ncbi:hypothetical protein VF04_04355 [Nostoc linckia z7]|uniref:Uncharacterized protein n=2 Tax=Nostoc linckia TaxID=92942 RepID=A0A9Q5ZG67_NOSLI|nr:hypothetical protein [Nostoc linckia]PHK42944.1 hypothetical protein VF12_01055 [Nostoc linckia z15]PHK48101.1 hypothetical protein VF13_02030 [Nostoc linckia z16]PHJ65021.1 hypothetical protein VF02_11840 [Nostoc linckia z1]PHJ70062.1 hypothetical protein VF05_11235 [Nostoc linckia z3]PHJ75100.1 hypothetical protein VF03_12160 [Nostoc linckia z2]